MTSLAPIMITAASGGGPATNIASTWPESPLEVAPTIALVLNRIRLPVCAASARAISTPGTSSALRQPYPVAVESPKIIRCRSTGVPRSQRCTGPPSGEYTPSARGGMSQALGITWRAWIAWPASRLRAPRYAVPVEASAPAAASAIVDRRGARICT
ncbi:hypothetical protein C1Y40_05576 [Mycobacterium talmoniae]|uniref:Uncharacterized protein n=1 Tax=Mycobacterium talmoniae TaxID=1858794 RepID=A0A2S8BC92_9MYCO|nr:hypothetical protein C1Y40_05576 [Mycobacterium talmoniae]